MIPGQNQPHESGGDPLDELLRQTLQHSTRSIQPPTQIWERIQGQVTAGPAPRSHRPPAERLSRLLAPFVQGMAAAAVVVLVGVSLISNRGGETRPLEAVGSLPTPVAADASAFVVRSVSVQRQGEPAIVDDALDYTSGRKPVQKRGPQVERSQHLRMVTDDPDINRILDSHYTLVVRRP